MTRPARTGRRRARRGAVLLEVLLSLALFVGAASFCLAAMRSLHAALDRADRDQRVIDLARSRMAELDAGLISLQALRGEWSGAVGSRQGDSLEVDEGPAQRRFHVDAGTSRSAYPGLTLVEITVTETQAGLSGAPASFTLRQLVALRDAEAEAYEGDELLQGQPSGAPPP